MNILFVGNKQVVPLTRRTSYPTRGQTLSLKGFMVGSSIGVYYTSWRTKGGNQRWKHPGES